MIVVAIAIYNKWLITIIAAVVSVVVGYLAIAKLIKGELVLC